MYIKIFISFWKFRRSDKVYSGINFTGRMGFFLGGGVKLSTRWMAVLESLWQRRTNVLAFFAAFINAYTVYDI